MANTALDVPGTTLVAICDPDQRVLDRRAGEFAEKRNIEVETEQDLRRILDRKDIDAVVVATPNHWHALATIWACQAGKDVYVEKPVSHTVWEGRQMVCAAAKHRRVVQAGLQNRSDTGLRAFKQWLKEGNLGDVEYVHTAWYRDRSPIGKVVEPTRIPPEVEYDLFCGPCEMGPLMRKNLHYDWHWQFEFGNGEMGNLGVHIIDEVRWLLDLGWPTRVMHAGARVAWDDDGDTPNISFAMVDFGDLPMILETRSIARIVDGEKKTASLLGRGLATLIVCEKGYFLGGRGGGKAFTHEGEVIQDFPGDSGATHMANFMECVRSRRADDLRTPIEEGHRSTAVCQMANIGYRLGGLRQLHEIEEMFASDGLGGPAAAPGLAALESVTSHLESIGVDSTLPVLRSNGWMAWDSSSERFSAGDNLGQANAMLRSAYREPFVVPEEV
jgi:predicted dehydrogenase